jgi:hypothetical protein
MNAVDGGEPILHLNTSHLFRLSRALLSELRATPSDRGTCEEIPRDSIQCVRDQFVGFEEATPVLGLKSLGFLDIIDGKFPQTVEFSIVGSWINCRQQIPGACASAVTSHPGHERLLVV